MAKSRVRWRWALPICQVLLAGTLASNATLEERTHRAETDERSAAEIPSPGTVSFRPMISWGYVPASGQILIAINFPAVLALSPIMLLEGDGNIFIRRSLLLAGVFLFWWCIGRWLDFQHEQLIKRRSLRIAVSGAGLLGSLGIGMATRFSYWGHSPLAHLGIILWCVFGIIFFGLMLTRVIRSRREPPSESATHTITNNT